jgi:hypothetical protein
VTSGSNGSCSVAYFCTAEAGYDGPTGLGTPDGTAAFTAASRTLPGSWTECAAENEICSFAGTHEVAFGANGSYNYATLSGGTVCSVAVFGDPAVGTGKSCYVQ